MIAVHVVDDLEGLSALCHPLRIQVLRALREPGSASSLSRELGESRQKLNYHLKELERAGLVRPVGERIRRNMVERLFEAIASSFLVAPDLTAGGADRARAISDQVALESLVARSEELRRDATALLDRAAFDGEQIASANVVATVRLADEQTRTAFMAEYVGLLDDLVSRYAGTDGPAYKVGATIHPDPEEQAHDHRP